MFLLFLLSFFLYRLESESSNDSFSVGMSNLSASQKQEVAGVVIALSVMVVGCSIFVAGERWASAGVWGGTAVVLLLSLWHQMLQLPYSTWGAFTTNTLEVVLPLSLIATGIVAAIDVPDALISMSSLLAPIGCRQGSLRLLCLAVGAAVMICGLVVAVEARSDDLLERNSSGFAHAYLYLRTAIAAGICCCAYLTTPFFSEESVALEQLISVMKVVQTEGIAEGLSKVAGWSTGEAKSVLESNLQAMQELEEFASTEPTTSSTGCLPTFPRISTAVDPEQTLSSISSRSVDDESKKAAVTPSPQNITARRASMWFQLATQVRQVVILCVGLVSSEAAPGENAQLEYELAKDRFTFVHSLCLGAVINAKAAIVPTTGDEIYLSWGIHSFVAEAPKLACRCALSLEAAISKAKMGECALGLCCGSTMCGAFSLGRSKSFRVLGRIMHEAHDWMRLSALDHVPCLIPDAMHQKVWFSFTCIPVDIVCLAAGKKPIVVSQVVKERESTGFTEWMYELEKMEQDDDEETKGLRESARCYRDGNVDRAITLLNEFRATHPNHVAAERLLRRYGATADPCNPLAAAPSCPLHFIRQRNDEWQHDPARSSSVCNDSPSLCAASVY